ncbi:HlyD family secretion protein [Rhodoblastus acidophilus]|uniref:Membrane fusion protein (MFP) family protein n=1 Tax=Rhodoblastus acidophilus TaxID=1074 RepID=A0A212S7I4_RHOAC|nr:HlyD family type I secretion periplasmic adaptor subunit [Rhodoblastus acidophilus]PPQ37211.1 HlyD family type I secretion periplasmic adaptor subunit [Rhodoblastus acidophilus]RAI16490.1 HlyD family type I secretion periplasmic adaptor subunit [Rhodoblastus acidophilus]SNB81153.1 HlyD family secretion protein [Rhodoblastus acidophilus]
MTDFTTDLADTETSIRNLMRAFLASVTLVCGGVVGWSVTTRIDSAVVAAGAFAVKSSTQNIQHPEGGIVGALFVRDGDLVREGQVLIRLDAAKVSSDASIGERKLIELIAERARLEAERQDAAAIVMPKPPAASLEARETLQTSIKAQQALLDEKRSARSSQLAQLAERRTQIETQIRGLNEQLSATRGEMQQAAGDLADQRYLDSKGLMRRPMLRQTEREVSRLNGQIGDAEARIASARSQLTETNFKIAEVKKSGQSDILTQLQTVVEKIAQAEQERTTALDRLQRLEIKAPRTGYVNELSVHTVGGVIAPGQTVMSIIPDGDPLLVTAKISPTEIDEVQAGRPATVRLSSLKVSTPPELEGVVAGVSPDQLKDERTGQPYFMVKIDVPASEATKLQGKALFPGMPAEVLIRGEARRVIAYLTQPLTDKIGLAFREK